MVANIKVTEEQQCLGLLSLSPNPMINVKVSSKAWCLFATLNESSLIFHSRSLDVPKQNVLIYLPDCAV